MKKLMSLILTIVMVALMIPFTAVTSTAADANVLSQTDFAAWGKDNVSGATAVPDGIVNVGNATVGANGVTPAKQHAGGEAGAFSLSAEAQGEGLNRIIEVAANVTKSINYFKLEFTMDANSSTTSLAEWANGVIFGINANTGIPHVRNSTNGDRVDSNTPNRVNISNQGDFASVAEVTTAIKTYPSSLKFYVVIEGDKVCETYIVVTSPEGKTGYLGWDLRNITVGSTFKPTGRLNIAPMQGKDVDIKSVVVKTYETAGYEAFANFANGTFKTTKTMDFVAHYNNFEIKVPEGYVVTQSTFNSVGEKGVTLGANGMGLSMTTNPANGVDSTLSVKLRGGADLSGVRFTWSNTVPTATLAMPEADYIGLDNTGKVVFNDGTADAAPLKVLKGDEEIDIADETAVKEAIAAGKEMTVSFYVKSGVVFRVYLTVEGSDTQYTYVPANAVSANGYFSVWCAGEGPVDIAYIDVAKYQENTSNGDGNTNDNIDDPDGADGAANTTAATTTAETTADEKKGCGSSIVAVPALIATAVLGCAVTVCKKSKED